MPSEESFASLAQQLAEIGRQSYARGWTFGTSGNFSAVVSEGYEMLKGLDGVSTHQHREWLPIIENTQDWAIAAAELEQLLRANPKAHGFLIRRHGLYTWGRDLAAAKRQMEILEFLFEAMGRKRGMTWQP